MKKTLGLVGLVIGVAVIYMVPSVGGHLARAARPVAAAHNCRNTQLSMQAQGSNGAAGTIMVVYRIHNGSGGACTLYGYPGVLLLNSQFSTLPTTVRRGGGFLSGIRPQLVTLAGHGNAYFTLAYSDVPVGNRPCQAPAHYVMIFAPNDYLPVVTYASDHRGAMYSCTGAIDVSPVTPQPRYQ